MADTYSKSGSEMAITSQVVRTVSYKELLFEKEMLQRQIEGLQNELVKINALIAEAEKLGLKTKE
jgi:hypothetical protein